MEDAGTTYPFLRSCPYDLPAEYDLPLHEAPVSRITYNGKPAWLVRRYSDVRTVLAHPHISPVAESPETKIRPGAGHINTMDPPEHTELRMLVARNFTVARIEERRPFVQGCVDGLIDIMLEAPKPVDLVKSFARPLTSMAICDVLGVPYEQDHDFFYEWLLAATTSTSEEALNSTSMKPIEDYIDNLVSLKEKDPDDRVISKLLVDARSGALTRREVAGIATMLMGGGLHTTANMIGLSVVVLLEHPEQLAELRDDPTLTAGAVEELLRYVDHIRFANERVAVEDIEIGGQSIAKGEIIIAASEIANRDESAFGNPGTLDIHRMSRNHLTFGHGRHVCIGAPLARLELEVSLSTLIRRIPTMRLAIPAEELPFRPMHRVHGFDYLPLTW
jgi:cytochrome P450